MVATVFAPELFEPKRQYRNKKRDDFLRANVGVDPALLADTLGLKEATIRMIQRKLGIRTCLNSPRKGDERWVPLRRK